MLSATCQVAIQAAQERSNGVPSKTSVLHFGANTVRVLGIHRFGVDTIESTASVGSGPALCVHGNLRSSAHAAGQKKVARAESQRPATLK
jgi:hypothetical protein